MLIIQDLELRLQNWKVLDSFRLDANPIHDSHVR
jgi:hypothetical protein